MRPVHKGIAAIVASAFGFALMALFVRLCDDYGAPVSCFEKSFFRNVVALAIAAVTFLREPRSRTFLRESRSRTLACEPRLRAFAPHASAFPLLFLRATLGTVGIFANFHALSHIPIAEGQTLNKTAPFFTVLFAWLLLGERATRVQIAALVVAFAGVLLIVKPGFAGAASFPLAMGVLGGASAGGAYVCLRALRNHAVSPSFIILFFSAFSCLASLPFMAVSFVPLTGLQVLILVGAGVGAALGQFGITLAYGYAAPKDVAVYDYTNILFTAAFGFLFFGQIPDLWSVLGFFVILAAAVYAAGAAVTRDA